MFEIALTGASGQITMNDIMVTLAALGSGTAAAIAGWVKFAQREKDQQLKARDETIEFLKKQITYLVSQQLPKGNKDDI